MSPDSHTLLIAFGGQGGAMGMQPFEFLTITEGFPTKRLFVRDLNRAWYHQGIPGGGSTIPEMAESLERLIAQHEVDRLVVTGVSGGGYAALAFGTLLGADLAVAFSPQTVLDLNVLATMDDHRFDPRLEELAATNGLDPRWMDLQRVLSGARCADTHYELHFDRTFRPDRLHAECLADLDGAQLHGHEGGGHNIARSLRDAGKLKPVLWRALGAPHPDKTTAGRDSRRDVTAAGS